MRPFSLADPEISFPYTHEKVTTAVLAVVCLVIPAAIILVVCLIFVPGPTVDKRTPFALKLRRKLWEWHVSWLGLAMSLAIAFFLTDGTEQAADTDSQSNDTVTDGYEQPSRISWESLDPTFSHGAILRSTISRSTLSVVSAIVSPTAPCSCLPTSARLEAVFSTKASAVSQAATLRVCRHSSPELCPV